MNLLRLPFQLSYFFAGQLDGNAINSWQTRCAIHMTALWEFFIMNYHAALCQACRITTCFFKTFYKYIGALLLRCLS
jgi:hypothetical protein